MKKKNETGKWGEDLAADRLAADGYNIVERNWHMGHYEIDIIAQKDRDLVFVEVKTRSNMDEDPLEALDRPKQLRIVRSAEVYLGRTDLNFNPRFDVFAINGTPDGDYRVEHIVDAFHAPLKTY